MSRVALTVETTINPTPRVLQLRGLFDLPEEKVSTLSWEAELPLDERDWQIGLIVGPSGSGKSTIARELWPKEIAAAYKWPADKAVVDGFPKAMGMRDITTLLSSVGFSSPPSWLRPFHALSNGEQFRVTMARVLAESPELAVVDEFTSVVDRTVAQIGSAAIAKTVRRRKQRLVAVTCHEDVEQWLTPDWVFRPATSEFTWGCLQRRPPIDLAIRRVEGSVYWPLFRPHHYLDAKLHPTALCYVAFWRDRPTAFAAWIPTPMKVGDMRRITRSVCLPDYQGVGIGNALNDYTAGMFKALGSRAGLVTTHPAMIASLNRSPRWAMTRKPSFQTSEGRKGVMPTVNAAHATRRRTASFEYIGPALEIDEARLLRASIK